jgi:hypothetical protein
MVKRNLTLLVIFRLLHISSAAIAIKISWSSGPENQMLNTLDNKAGLCLISYVLYAVIAGPLSSNNGWSINVPILIRETEKQPDLIILRTHCFTCFQALREKNFFVEFVWRVTRTKNKQTQNYPLYSS